ncbi:folM alternative dihydrofolate reductase 1 [alpha proteobacterium U9-1i]|nr:folM alternative dihydrofolate reductase 1 [alpha proteobacterium U9-1i]
MSRGAVLVTGAGKRVGAAIAARLGADGWFVWVHHNSAQADAEGVAKGIITSGGRAETVRADLSREGEIDAMAAKLAARGDWSGVVNSAASFIEDRIDTFTFDAAERQIRLNLIAPIYLARRFAADGRRGFVVNIADQKVLNPNPDFLSYTLAKLGLAHATATLAMALAPNVRVNCIAPGLMLPSGDQTAENFARVHSRTLTGRGATPAQVADAVAFFATADNITGALLPVDGGQHLVPSARDVMFS